MDTEFSEPQTIDLAGLPDLVVEELTRLVAAARRQQTPVVPTGSGNGRPSLLGIFAHLAVETPTLEEFERVRREMWAGFPRDFPDASE